MFQGFAAAEPAQPGEMKRVCAGEVGAPERVLAEGHKQRPELGDRLRYEIDPARREDRVILRIHRLADVPAVGRLVDPPAILIAVKIVPASKDIRPIEAAALGPRPVLRFAKSCASASRWHLTAVAATRILVSEDRGRHLLAQAVHLGRRSAVQRRNALRPRIGADGIFPNVNVFRNAVAPTHEHEFTIIHQYRARVAVLGILGLKHRNVRHGSAPPRLRDAAARRQFDLLPTRQVVQ